MKMQLFFSSLQSSFLFIRHLAGDLMEFISYSFHLETDSEIGLLLKTKLSL